MRFSWSVSWIYFWIISWSFCRLVWAFCSRFCVSGSVMWVSSSSRYPWAVVRGVSVSCFMVLLVYSGCVISVWLLPMATK